MAVRLSIGAGKTALVRQVLVESTMLAFIGGLLGVALAYAATPVLLKLLSSDLSQSSISARPDGVILLVMACATILSGIAFGLLPALQSARTDLAAALKSEGSTGHTGGRLWLRRSLVGAQVAFSMLLLTGAMLFTKSLRNVERINPGFRTDHLITFKVNPTQVGYSQPRLQVFAEDVRNRLRNLHGVTGLALVSMAVLEDDSWGGGITVEGSSMRDLNNTEILKNQVSPGFFETLNIPLLAGRTFIDHDLHSNVAVVNATFARHFLHSSDPVGRHFQFGLETGTPKYDWTIVGMVADSQHTGLRTPVKPFVYLPYFTGGDLQSLTFYVRTAGGERAVMSQIRTVMQNVDPALPLYDFRTLDELIASQLFAERGLALLSLLFAGLAITLATIGLYGVIGYSVTRRRREFGIRMAIGATPRSVLGIVLRETAFIGGVSLVCALPLVLLGGRTIQSALYGVQPGDPAICVGAALLLFTIAMLAGLLPARKAAAIDPQVALRMD
jgi:predicted permease